MKKILVVLSVVSMFWLGAAVWAAAEEKAREIQPEAAEIEVRADGAASAAAGAPKKTSQKKIDGPRVCGVPIGNLAFSTRDKDAE